MRFTAITIENFKNVEYGELSFANKRCPDGPSVLALYGQNGSGKSALVDCIELFKEIMGGRGIPDRFANFVTKGASSSRIEYELETIPPFEPYCHIRYEVEFAPYTYISSFNSSQGDKPKSITTKAIIADPDLYREFLKPDNVNDGDLRVRILSESLSYSIPGESRMKTVFTTAGTDSFKPAAAKSSFVEVGMAEDKLQRFKNACYDEAHSCLHEYFDIITTQSPNAYDNERKADDSINLHIFESLRFFAWNELFVVGTREAEALESGSMVLYVDYEALFGDCWEDPIGIELFYGSGALRVSTDAGSPIPLSDGAATAVSITLEEISTLLTAIVPGLTLRLHRNEEAMLDGSRLAYVESCREGRSIPLSCESRGVQKLVSVAWLLVSVYNSARVTAVIDELDSGIFEYLLGEILRIVSEEGQGQLIFTSHNLRPLEVLDKGYVAFTTSNPSNRYIRMKNVKTTNNLRDFYYRSILLGGQGESIYEPSTNGEISLAFMKAGESAFRARKAYEDELEEYQEELTSRLSSYNDSQNRTAEGSEDSDV